MSSQLLLVLENITSWVRYLGEGAVALVAIGLIVSAFSRTQGSLPRVLTIVGCALLAAALIWQLPDLLKLATNDSGTITGVDGGRY
jgi:hypothetical protein